MSKSLFEELSEFTDELVILLKEDWEKTKKFVREHKKYFFWLCALFIGAQFTDIMTLGKSWDAYCKKNGIQKGGEGDPVATDASTDAKAATTTATPATTDAKAAATPATTDAKAAATPATTDAKATADAKAALKSQRTSSKKDGKKKGMTQSMAQSMRRNPVFGNMNNIFSMTTSMFSLALFLLAIVGILSLPVIIFIIITYCVIKSLLNKLAIL